MKKFLLGTTALLAAGLVSGEASAQASKADPIKLQLGGFVAFAGGDILRQNDGPNTTGQNKKTFEFKENIVLGGLGETKLDNGLVVGANIQVRGQDNGRQVTQNVDGDTGANRSGLGFAQNDMTAQAYGYFKGEFGQVVFGDVRDATSQKSYQAPIAGQIFGANSPLFAFTNNPVGTNSTIQDLGGTRATGIHYFSPTISGFSFGASFKPQSARGISSGLNCAGASTPNGATDNPYLGANIGCTAFNNSLNAVQDIAAIHVNYDAKFGDFTLGVGGGAAHSTKEKGIRAGQRVLNNGVTTIGLVNTDGDLNNYYGSFNVIYGPFAVGGAWERRQNAFFNGANVDTFDFGGRYTMGPAQFSLGGTRGYYKGLLATGAGGVGVVNNFNNGSNISNATGVAPALFNPTATPTLTDIQAVVNYQLGPGIALTGAVDWSIYHSHASNTAGAAVAAFKNYESIALLAGTRLNF